MLAVLRYCKALSQAGVQAWTELWQVGPEQFFVLSRQLGAVAEGRMIQRGAGLLRARVNRLACSTGVEPKRLLVLSLLILTLGAS
jgi:hypothetical protein